MLVYIRFLGTLSARFGASPISTDIEPAYMSLQEKIRELIGDEQVPRYMLLQNGKPFNAQHPIICEQDEFCVFFPISGG